MARQTRSRVSRGTSQRRKLVWARSITSNLVLAGNGTTNDPLLADFQTTYGAQLIGCTVVRIRGWLKVSSTLPEDEFVVVGIRVITDTETLPAAAGPIVDPHADWMYYDVLQEGSLDGGRYFDVKAMRKIDELGQGLSMIFEHAGATATNIDLVVSVLVALP